MSNPFGLPSVLVAEREARRCQRFRIGVFTTLVTATVLLAGMLIQGCRSQRQSPIETVVEKPVRAGMDSAAANPPPNSPPVPEPAPESAAETNCVSPGSTSLPDNITLPAPSKTSVAHGATSHPLSPAKEVRKTAVVHNPPDVYVVKSGDSLLRIAKIHGMTVKALKAANHLKSDRIFVGEKLKVSQPDLAAATTVQN
jgi:LysM repeat protein